MSIETHHNDDSPGEQETQSLVSASVGDRCVNCGSSLASDQRYCVVCGERRGAARFTLPATTPVVETSSPSPRNGDGGRNRPRVSGGATLVAGVGTLLLAMGVGVLIGHNSGGSTKTVAAAAPKVTVITTGGGTAAPSSSGAASSGASSSTAAGSTGSSSSTGTKSKASKTAKSKAGAKGAAKSSAKASASKSKVSAAAAKKASQAASQVLGGSSANTPPPTVTVGQKAPKGEQGVNKKTGKFDGSFFGG